MPPSWMPTELKLAKPASANDAMVNERGSSCSFIGPSWAKAMNSFSTMRVPSRLPIVPLSCHGTPIAHAIGRKIQPSTVCRLAGNHSALAVNRREAAVEERHQRDERHQHRDHVEHQLQPLARPAGRGVEQVHVRFGMSSLTVP